VHPPQSLNIFFNNYLYVKLDCALNLYELIDTYQQMLDFSPTASMTIMGEKLGMNSQIGQPVCYGSGRDPFFSGAVDSFNSIDDSAKVYHVWRLPSESVRVTYVD
jgi:hypothetical protein